MQCGAVIQRSTPGRTAKGDHCGGDRSQRRAREVPDAVIGPVVVGARRAFAARRAQAPATARKDTELSPLPPIEAAAPSGAGEKLPMSGPLSRLSRSLSRRTSRITRSSPSVEGEDPPANK